jgi:hypothetical protein
VRHIRATVHPCLQTLFTKDVITADIAKFESNMFAIIVWKLADRALLIASKVFARHSREVLDTCRLDMATVE